MKYLWAEIYPEREAGLQKVNAVAMTFFTEWTHDEFINYLLMNVLICDVIH